MHFGKEILIFFLTKLHLYIINDFSTAKLKIEKLKKFIDIFQTNYLRDFHKLDKG